MGVENIVECIICECHVSDDKIKHIAVKGNIKNICEEYVDSVKGLI